MGLMQQAYDTYCAMAPQYAGIYGKAKEPLVPVSHQIVNAELELTLDADGHLLDARSVEAEPGHHDHPCDGEFLGANR